MKLLMIAWGYLPYTFSEGLCNGKLVYALKEAGIETTVISRVDNGPTYETTWNAPWDTLEADTILIDYPVGSTLLRLADIMYSSIVMDGFNEPGVRWARRAFQKALELVRAHSYDAILTRSPNDVAHLIGYKLKKKTGIKWIANWNDPASPIWPGEYKINYSEKEQKRKERFVECLLRYADVNTFPADSLRKHFAKHYPFLNESRTAVIPHIGLSEKLWPAMTKKSNIKLRLLHSGNLSSERNPENLFRAMSELKREGYTQFEFHIMGRINEYTQGLISKYELETVVKSIGSFPYLDAVREMQEYDVLVLIEAKLEQGIFFASKFSDYAQTGLPILAVSPRNGFANDMISSYGGGIVVDNTNTNEIKSGLKILIEKWEMSALDGFCSRNLFENFSPNMVVEQYRTIIEG